MTPRQTTWGQQQQARGRCPSCRRVKSVKDQDRWYCVMCRRIHAARQVGDVKRRQAGE